MLPANCADAGLHEFLDGFLRGAESAFILFADFQVMKNSSVMRAG